MSFPLCGLGRQSHGCDRVGVLRLKSDLEEAWSADGLGELGFLVYAAGLTRIILIGDGHTLETSLQRSGCCHLVGEDVVDAALR